ncbi:MAG: S41 family peptidase [Planctomycetota bacterium]
MDDSISQLNSPVHVSFSSINQLARRIGFAQVRRNLALAGALLVMLFSTMSTAHAAPQANYDISTATAALEQGDQFETKGEWGDALSLYQQALRKFPQDELLKTRRSVARIHYDLDRRYADSSFIKTIRMTNGNTAASVYAEVLLKVESYYVDQPNWADLASYGLTSLEVALMSPEFRQVNLPNLSIEEVRQTILKTRKQLETARVNNRNDAYLVAVQTAQNLQESIGLSTQATLYEFVCGAISALDPYSAFMSSNQYSETMSQIEGNFVGLGVELRTHKDHLEIVNVIRGGSADQGGIVEGDKIIAVDQLNVSQYGPDRVADTMRGIEGSMVSVTVDRGDGPVSIRLERRRLEIPSVDQVGIVDQNFGVGYIKLTNFQKTTARDFDAALRSLAQQGMRSLIVDVRGNPGGLLSASVEVADRFVGEGVIVSTKGRNPIEDFVHRANVANTWRVPLVVLVDENSASASEIFAAAIRDHHRGLIVGEQSYGKGSVQGIFPLSASGGGVRLTTAKFFSPIGNPINQVGVQADVTLQQVAKANSQRQIQGEDQGLRVGIQTARRVQDQRNAGAPTQKSARSQFESTYTGG